MVKEIIHSKIEYLELLIENPDGVTSSEVEEIWDGVTRDVARKALIRLYKQGCAKRVKEGLEYRYWITDRGIQKYHYLTRGETQI